MWAHHSADVVLSYRVSPLEIFDWKICSRDHNRVIIHYWVRSTLAKSKG